MASVAILTAESNPKEISVPQISLSIVLGTETILSPIAASLAAVFCVPLPPMQTTQSSPISLILCSIKAGLFTSSATTPPFLKGFSREVHNIVPPWFNNPDKDISVKGSLLSRCGLYNIIPLEGNSCVFKFGKTKSFVSDINNTSLNNTDVYNAGIKNTDGLSEDIIKDDYECIVVVNTRQFVSEMMLNPAEITMEVLDSADSKKTFAYMKRSGNRVIYSKFNMFTMSEEVVLYDFENKIKQIRINNDIKEASDLNYTYVINDNPYTIKKDKEAMYLVNLNTQKEEYKMPPDMKIRYVINDVILVTRIKRGIPFIKKNSEYIEAYKFPDIQHVLLKKKAEFKTCIINGEDLLVFTM